MYQIAVENQFDFLSLEYATLHRASWATAFQHPKWLSALYGQLLTQNAATPLVVVVRRTSDRSLAMVLPLIRRRYGMLKVVEFADLRVSDYAAVVADRHEAKALLDDEGIRSELKRLLKPYDVLRIGKVPDDELIDVHEEGMADALEAEHEMAAQQARAAAPGKGAKP